MRALPYILFAFFLSLNALAEQIKMRDFAVFEKAFKAAKNPVDKLEVLTSFANENGPSSPAAKKLAVTLLKELPAGNQKDFLIKLGTALGNLGDTSVFDEELRTIYSKDGDDHMECVEHAMATMAQRFPTTVTQWLKKRGLNYSREYPDWWLHMSMVKGLETAYARSKNEEIDALIRSWFTTKERPDACFLTCKMVHSAIEWISNENLKNSKANWQGSEESDKEKGISDAKKINQATLFATRALALLFILKSRPYCPEARSATETLFNLWFPTANLDWAKRKSESQFLTDKMKEIAPGLDPETLQNLNSFQARLAQTAGSSEPHSSPVVYANQYYNQVLREFLRGGELSASAKKDIRKALKVSDASLRDYLRHFRTLSRRGEGGSIFMTHLVATTAMSSGLSENAERVTDFFHDVMVNNKDLCVPYNCESTWGGWRETPRGAAGRALVMHLALYFRPSREEYKDSYRALLIKALENFAEHSAWLAFHVQRDDTHTGPDALAPYYYYPTLPYVTAATEMLLKDPQTTPEERKRIVDTKEKVLNTLFTMVDLKTGQAKSLGMMYGESRGYATPFMGLSILPLIKECYGTAKPQSYGLMEIPHQIQKMLPNAQSITH